MRLLSEQRRKILATEFNHQVESHYKNRGSNQLQENSASWLDRGRRILDLNDPNLYVRVLEGDELNFEIEDSVKSNIISLMREDANFTKFLKYFDQLLTDKKFIGTKNTELKKSLSKPIDIAISFLQELMYRACKFEPIGEYEDKLRLIKTVLKGRRAKALFDLFVKGRRLLMEQYPVVGKAQLNKLEASYVVEGKEPQADEPVILRFPRRA